MGDPRHSAQHQSSLYDHDHNTTLPYSSYTTTDVNLQGCEPVAVWSKHASRPHSGMNAEKEGFASAVLSEEFWEKTEILTFTAKTPSAKGLLVV